jgi:hypothetical protein
MDYGRVALVGAAACLAFAAAPALAEDAPPQSTTQATPQPAAQQTAAPTQAATTAPAAADAAAPTPSSGGLLPGILSRDAFTVLLDGRLVVADGATSFVHRGFGITRFQGDSKGGYMAQLVPAEADLVWNPRFTGALSANVSIGWERSHEPGVGVMEAFLNYLPQSQGKISFSARAGLMWPEISLEHATGGAWSTVYTITPSAINSWVGEEVRVVGLEGTAHFSLGQHEVLATAAVFGWDDTSGTLLSFRGWALEDIKGTAPGYFPLPPRNGFFKFAQQNLTQNTLHIDPRAGFYARLDWRPPQPFGVAAFYYDNNGDPTAVTHELQWGWRTRFGNLGINADLDSKTRLLAQAMIGSTQMGQKYNGVLWIDTDYQSAFVLLSRKLPWQVTVSGRVEAFETREHGSLMEPHSENNQDGSAWTLAARKSLNPHLTVFAEALHVRSWRGTRVDLGGLDSPFEAQTVFQLALRYRL